MSEHEPTSAPAVPDWLHQVAAVAERPQDSELVRKTAHLSGGRQSAVLMLFGPDGAGGESVVLTERAWTLRQHPGQVSFPGGRIDPEDDGPVDAALREAEEEIGLDRSGVHVVGRLPLLPLSVTGFSVTPVLAWWPRPTPVRVVDTAEVGRVEVVPLAELVDPANRFTSVHPARHYAMPAFEVRGLYVWGFTAAIIDETLRLAGLEQAWDVADERPVPPRYLAR